VRSEPQYQHGKRQNQNGSCYDEQEKNVRKFGLPLAQHAEESGERGPEGRGADCEERQIVELIKAFCDSGIFGA
jgi:hypothetical protein